MTTGVRIEIEEIQSGSHTDHWRAKISAPDDYNDREVREIRNSDLEDLLADIAEQIISVPANDAGEDV